MKYYLSIIALIIVSLFISSGFATSSADIAIGNKAPDFTLSGDSIKFSLKDARGTKVLITFWSVTDAASRCDCNAYSAALSHTDIKHIAVNLDNNSTLYKEVIKNEFTPASQFFSPDEYTATRLAKSYGLDGNYGSVLISAEGEIIAINPQSEVLKR